MYDGFLENYAMTKKRFPSKMDGNLCLTAKFDFRKAFEETVRIITVYDGQRSSHMTIESFMDPQGTNPICLKQDYFDATMTNCVTERTLEENNIKPNVLVNGYNFFKGDLITYMFWNKKQMQAFALPNLLITIPPPADQPWTNQEYPQFYALTQREIPNYALAQREIPKDNRT